MIKKIAVVLISVVVIISMALCSGLSAQTITGRLSLLANGKVKLMGFEGWNHYGIDSSTVAADGTFRLNYLQADYGMGYLMAEDNKPFFVILSGEGIELRGESIASAETIKIQKGKENQLFEQYALEHPRREQTLSAWIYLRRIYEADPLFDSQGNPKQAIETEIQRIRQEDQDFLGSLPPESFVSWYLPIRKLISSVSVVAQYRSEEIPETIAAFRALDYTDERLFKSGLLSDAIESHFWLIENSGRGLDSVYVEMKISIDHLMENLLLDEIKFNLITDYLFNLLERRSLFEASEYLALKVLNETRCTIDNNLASQMESYRAMKTGTIAPDFAFQEDCLAPGYAPNAAPQKLSDLKSKFTVVVFGANWCPACPDELFQIARLYDKWKTHGVEVIFVSLDEDKQVFRNFARVFPFISICDYQKWESPIVKAWHVIATPTMYLLNEKREILLRPNSVSHLDSWVDWYLVEGKR